MGDHAMGSPPRALHAFTPAYLVAVLRRERDAAEATLGRPLIAPYAFAADCITEGLGYALNAEQGRIDELVVQPKPT